MVRNVGAVILGMLIGSVVNMAVVVGMTVIWPLPEGVDIANTEQMAAYVATLPAAAWLCAMLAHLLQALVGGGVAARVGRSHPVRLALVVGGLSLIGGVMNAINLSAPLWVWIEMPLYLVVAGGAGKLEELRRARRGSG